jgi:hypothetical protein
MAALALRNDGLSWDAVGAKLGLSAEAARKLVARMLSER